VLLGKGLGVAQPAERAPRQEGETELLAHVDLRPAAPEGGGELVLHADERVPEPLVRRPDLIRVGVRQPDHPHLPGVADLRQRADHVGIVDLRVGPVVLPQVDLLHPQPLQARVHGGVQVLRPAVEPPAPAVSADVTALGGQQHPVPDSELVEEPGDQQLVLALRSRPELVAGTVGVRGVEQGDAGVQCREHRVGELVARLRAGLVEGHQPEPDRAHLDSSDPVVPDLSCSHGGLVPRSGHRQAGAVRIVEEPLRRPVPGRAVRGGGCRG
jgi:hypothetical protein